MQIQQAIRPNFWQDYPLHELTHAEWESLCDGCGVCCLIKFLDEDESQDMVAYTDVGCQLLDCQTGWCQDYDNRHDTVPDCITLSFDKLANMLWLPNTCAYKRLYVGLDLPEWHHLVTGNREQSRQLMQQADVGVAGRCISEVGITDDEMEERIVQWVVV